MNSLHNFTLGTPQQVGIMTVIPLLGENASFEIGSMDSLSFSGTSSYGSMVFKNNSGRPVIIPNGYSVITKQSAQDHGLPFSVLVEPGKQEFNNACCIEQTQPGMIDGSSVSDFYLLPLYVRKEHFRRYVYGQSVLIQSMGYSRLWDIITEFQAKLVNENYAHLVYFFTKFVQDLNRFNAEFEPVLGQRGAIIMLQDEVVGIEIMPTQEDWNLVWNKLIRDCYGSEIIRLTQLQLVHSFEQEQKNKWDLSSCQSIEEIESYIQSRQSSLLERVRGEIDSLLLRPRNSHTHYSHLGMNAKPWEGIEYQLSSTENGSHFFELYQTEQEVLYFSALKQ